jgi:predicted ATP-grasp superfamily ATP-dependent carboligase
MFRLFVGTNGIDVARALYLDLTGQQVEMAGAQEGRKWLVENHDIISSLRYLRDGRLILPSWLQSFRGVNEGAWFAPDDPLPYAVKCLRFLARGPQKLSQALARRARGRSLGA